MSHVCQKWVSTEYMSFNTAIPGGFVSLLKEFEVMVINVVDAFYGFFSETLIRHDLRTKSINKNEETG